ncbi:MAG: hypothetical protein ACREBR_02815 [bacterium]
MAQVHIAIDKVTKKKLAVMKIQHHRGLKETCAGHLVALTVVVRTAEILFNDFSWGVVS